MANEPVILRELRPEDWRAFRSARLKALREHPDVYLSSYNSELEKPEWWWKETLDGKGKSVFGLFADGQLIGFAAVFTWRRDPSGCSGVMAMDYVAPQWRGKGLSRLLYQARIDWAVGQRQFARLVISHRDGNEISRKANQAFGFEYTGREVIQWPDGAKAEEWNYRLDLDKLRSA